MMTRFAFWVTVFLYRQKKPKWFLIKKVAWQMLGWGDKILKAIAKAKYSQRHKTKCGQNNLI
jgi:hypothetical protein